MAKNKLYLYLARLDRRGIEVVAAFPYPNKVYQTRVKDVPSLCLPPDLASSVSKAASDNRMTHELYAESSESMESLKDALRKRGYSNLPTHQFNGNSRAARVNEAALVTKDSVMVQRSRR